MDHREGADKTGDVRLDFDRRVRLEFHGSKISSNGGMLLFRELDEVLGLHDIAAGLLRDTRTGHNRLHSLVGLLRQSVFGRLAGYDDVNDADRLSLDPVMRQVVGGRAVDARPHPQARWDGSKPRCWQLRIIALRWLTCQGNGSTGFTNANLPSGSRWIWIARSARPTERRKTRPGTVISAACVITRCSSSISVWSS